MERSIVSRRRYEAKVINQFNGFIQTILDSESEVNKGYDEMGRNLQCGEDSQNKPTADSALPRLPGVSLHTLQSPLGLPNVTELWEFKELSELCTHHVGISIPRLKHSRSIFPKKFEYKGCNVKIIKLPVPSNLNDLHVDKNNLRAHEIRN